jgi:hypothetical protein
MNTDLRRILWMLAAGVVCAGVLTFLWKFLLRGLPG